MKAVLPEVEQLDLELPEIQEINGQEIIKAKLREAFNHVQGELIVEDTSLYLDCLHGLPGPLIKWFLKAMGNDGLVNLAKKFGNDKAIARTIIGYARSQEDIHFFDGTMSGRIVELKGRSGFGWDPIFLPDGHKKTFAEMSWGEKNQVSMRTIALNNLKEFLRTQE